MPLLTSYTRRKLDRLLGSDSSGNTGLAAMAYFDVLAYGAKCDGIRVESSSISITSGSASLTVTGATFGTGDVGKMILVPGAGASGAALITTILSRTSNTQVTLAANAGTTVSAAYGVVWYGTDDTAAIQNALNSIITFAGAELFFPPGICLHADTITLGGLTGRPNIKIRGGSPPGLAGGSGTTIVFLNATTNKVGWQLTPQTSSVTLSDLAFEDGQPRTSKLMRFAAYPQTISDVNSFGCMERVWFKAGKVGLNISTDGSVLDGTQQNWVDSFSYFHCTFVECETGILGQNMQAFHHCFFGCNWIASYPGHGAASILIDDQCGMGISVFGGSALSSGRYYRMNYDASASGIWIQGYLRWHDVRMEARNTAFNPATGSNQAETPYGCLIEESVSSPPTNKFRRAAIEWEGGDLLVFPNTGTDVIRYSGSVRASFCRCEAGSQTGLTSGFARIKQNPVVGSSMTYGDGSFGAVIVEDCPGFGFLQDTANTYGTFDAAATSLVKIGYAARVNASMTADSDGFFSSPTADFEQRGYGLSAGNRRYLRWNNDNITQFVGITSTALIIPPGDMPVSFSYEKHPVQFSQNIQWKLYLVKDKANWAGGTLNLATDAFLVATTPDSTNKAGLMEATVQLVDDYLTGAFRAGSALWTEGRMYALVTGNLVPSNMGAWNIGGNATVSKSGTTGILTEDSSNTTHWADWFVPKATTNIVRTVTIKAKRVAGHANRDIVYQDNVGANGVFCSFDLGGGGAGTPTATGTGWTAGLASQTGPDSDGYYTNTFSYTTGAETFESPSIFLLKPGTGVTYAGDGVSGVQFSDIQLPGDDTTVCGAFLIAVQ